MKVRASLRRICASCKVVKRGRKLFVICPSDAWHKQRQRLHTWATQVAAAPAPTAASAALPMPTWASGAVRRHGAGAASAAVAAAMAPRWAAPSMALSTRSTGTVHAGIGGAALLLPEALEALASADDDGL